MSYEAVLLLQKALTSNNNKQLSSIIKLKDLNNGKLQNPSALEDVKQSIKQANSKTPKTHSSSINIIGPRNGQHGHESRDSSRRHKQDEAAEIIESEGVMELWRRDD